MTWKTWELVQPGIEPRQLQKLLFNYLRANQAAQVGIDWHTVFGIHDGP